MDPAMAAFWMLLAVFGLVILSGCEDGAECQVDDDCSQGEFCSMGQCMQEESMENELPPWNNTDDEKDRKQDAGADSDSDSDSDGDTDSDDDGERSCSTASDCPDKPCAIKQCATDGVCVYFDKKDGEPCSDGIFCNGEEFCQAGECRPAVMEACVQVSKCVEVECLEDEKRCVETEVEDGTPCSEAKFCRGGETDKCYSGICVPTSLDNPCTDTPPPCAVYQCNEQTDSCDLMEVGNGTFCFEPDAGVNARSGMCQTGSCMALSAPCESGNPCWKSEYDTDLGACVDAGPVGPDERCGDECMGQESRCYGEESPVCVPDPDDSCSDSDISTRESCDVIDWDKSCVDGDDRIIDSLMCNRSVVLSERNVHNWYSSAEYVEYGGGNCHGRDEFAGYEMPFEVMHSGTVSVEITDEGTEPEDASVYLLLLEDLADPFSCAKMGKDQVSHHFSTSGPYYLVIETLTQDRFSSIGLEVTCE